jgi:hypothetical protein
MATVDYGALVKSILAAQPAVPQIQTPQPPAGTPTTPPPAGGGTTTPPPGTTTPPAGTSGPPPVPPGAARAPTPGTPPPVTNLNDLAWQAIYSGAGSPGGPGVSDADLIAKQYALMESLGPSQSYYNPASPGGTGTADDGSAYLQPMPTRTEAEQAALPAPYTGIDPYLAELLSQQSAMQGLQQQQLTPDQSLQTLLNYQGTR